MKTLLKFLFVVSVFLFVFLDGNTQSCVITRVPSSSSLPQAGGQTVLFSIILYGNCTPIFSVSNSWLSYIYTPVDNTHGTLRIYASANTGTPRTGYVYVDNKESLKITISQSGTYVYVTGVTVTPASAFINVGKTFQLTATVSPPNATNKFVIWSSSNNAIATVSSTIPTTEQVTVTGIGAGTATIYATSLANSAILGTATITVSEVVPSFSWKNRHGGKNYTTPAKDQINGDPCFLFAAVGAVEAMYKIYFNHPEASVDLSEGQLNIFCLNTSLSIQHALDFIRNNGVVYESCYPYSRSIYGGGTSPFPDCYAPCSNYSDKVKIPGYTTINLQNVAVDLRADYLKRIILSKGTVALNFSGSSLHSGAMHAYELYGWNDTFWLLKDSWQGSSIPRYISTDINIPQILATGSGSVACYVEPIIEAVKMTCKEYNAPAWFDQDGDGYYFWGIGPKPAGCPGNVLPDGDDGNASKGPMDPNGFCTIMKSSVSKSGNNAEFYSKDIINTDDFNKKDIYIFPNPANTQITLVNLPSDEVVIQIYKMDGTLVLRNQIRNNKIDVSKLPQGIYIVKLIVNNKHKVLNFIKE